MIAAAIFVVLPLCLAVAALSDLFMMTIPNRISVIISLTFLIIAPLAGMPLATIGAHFAGALAVLIVCFILFAMNVMGGGDAKLLAATALWFGLDPSLIEFLAYVGIIGGVGTLLILMIRSQTNLILAMGLPVPNSILMAKKIPYGIAIAAGGFLAFPSSALFLTALHGLA